jgi:hypothetical protein
MAGGRYGKVKIEQRVANKIAEMLVSKDPSVVQKAIKQIAQTPILNAVRKLDEVLEKAGTGRGIAVIQSAQQTQPE